MREPLVTVICLCYNHEPFIKDAIESVITQSYEAVQIIVWDDASTDNSQAVIRELEKIYPQLQVFLSEKNEGNCRAFNRAYAYANGEFIVDFSTDDVMHELRLEKQVHYFSKMDERTGVVFTDATYVDERSNFIRHHYEHLFRHRLISKVVTGDVFRTVLTTYYIASPTMMMRRSVFDELGGYDEALAYEDLDLWIRSGRVYRYEFLDERLTFIRKLSKSLSGHSHVPGDKQLQSTYLVCLKAVALCRDEGDREALIHRVSYELRHAALSGNHSEANLFWQLLKTLREPAPGDKLWQVVNLLRLPLSGLRRLYHRVRYAS
ncbi:MAG TPA: glycosyltransferase [Chryseolinea sp.]|nr:glycosyltransferase [Chryseolinea sp.]